MSEQIKTIETSDFVVFTEDGRILYDIGQLITVFEAEAVRREGIADRIDSTTYSAYSEGYRAAVEAIKRERDMFSFDASNQD